jgi:hypothetical protein
MFKTFIKTLFVCFLIVNIPSCNSTTSHSNKIRKQKNLNEFQAKFLNMRSFADKLVFKQYYLNPDSNIRGDYSKPVWVDSTNDVKKIADFNGLFKDVDDGGYCCCPWRHYTVSFYKDNKELGYYCMDTVGIKDAITFFDESMQTSYVIDLKTWNSYLERK